jgi:hypothetical protein
MSSSKNNKNDKAGSKAAAEDRRARLAAIRKEAERERARRTLIRRIGITAGGLVLVGGVVGGAIAVHNAGGGKTTSAAAKPTDSVKNIPTTPLTQVKGAATSPPWAAPANVGTRVQTAGLPMLGTEGQVEHIHAHLDVIVNGKAVTVPALIGIDEAGQQISPLHTHDTSGVIHIESPKQADFTLGQVMTEWNVALTKDSIGGLKAGNGDELHVYVDGKEQSGNPGAIKLAAHQEIAVVYGKASDKVTVPSSYKFPSGE